MKNWFNFKGVLDGSQRTVGFLIRIIGIDFSVLLLGWVSDWKFIDLRIPVNSGIYFQVLFALISLGRVPTETYEVD